MADRYSQANFYSYRSPDDPPSEEEEITTRQELTFEEEPRKAMAEDPTQTILAALAALLKNQQEPKTFRARIREPDTYHGACTLNNAAASWLRSVE